MLKRIFVLLALALMAVLFLDIAGNFTERSELTGISEYYATEGAAELGAANLVTSVVVTHDIPLARRVGDLVAFLETGNFTFYGTWDKADADAETSFREFLEANRECHAA